MSSKELINPSSIAIVEMCLFNDGVNDHNVDKEATQELVTKFSSLNAASQTLPTVPVRQPPPNNLESEKNKICASKLNFEFYGNIEEARRIARFNSDQLNAKIANARGPNSVPKASVSPLSVPSQPVAASRLFPTFGSSFLSRLTSTPPQRIIPIDGGQQRHPFFSSSSEHNQHVESVKFRDSDA